MPRVSIVTASYNYENYIKETIESVISQTFQDWEMIIVDDGSIDNSVEVIKSYCANDNRIKLFTHSDNQNKGLIETIKLGISKATSDWIIFLESDDTIASNYIEKKLDVIEKYPDIKFIFNDINMFGDTERMKDLSSCFKRLYQVADNTEFPANLVKHFSKFNLVPTFSCVMLKKEILDNLKWNAVDSRCVDYYIWAQLAKDNDFYFVKEKLTNWRMSKQSFIKRPYPIIKSSYFQAVQMPSVIKGFSYFYYVKFILLVLKELRKKAIKLKLSKKEKSLILFGKTLFKLEN